MDTITMRIIDQNGNGRWPFQSWGITWLKLGRLIMADDPSPFPALTQVEVYGGRR